MPSWLHVLSISLDETLLVDDSRARGDAAARQRQYAAEVQRLDVLVFTRRNHGPNRRTLAPNVTAYATQSGHSLLYVRDALRLAERVRDEQGVAHVVATQDPFLTGVAGYLLKRRWHAGLNVQVFSSFFGNPQWLSDRPVNRLLHVLGRQIVLAADTVRVESPIEKQHLVSLGVQESRVWVIPLLYNFERFARADGTDVRARLLEKRFSEIALYVGRLAPEKDVPSLLRAVSILAPSRPGLCLVVVGKGAEETRLRSLAAELSLEERVMFAGAVENEELPAYFQACDVFVLPSLYEGIPTVLIEAASSGKPVVATGTRNVTDVVLREHTGLVVPIADPAALARALNRLLSNPSEARRMGTAGRELVRTRFSSHQVLSDLGAMWEATASQSRATPRGR